MLYWTCPECGRECSPAVRECPACPPAVAREQVTDAALGQTQVENGIRALAQNLETIHAVPVMAPVAEQSIPLRENGHSVYPSANATLMDGLIDPDTGSSGTGVMLGKTLAPVEEVLADLAAESSAVAIKHEVDSLVR